MKFTKNDIFVGMKFINTNDTVVKVVDIDNYYIIQYSKVWKSSYPIGIESFIERVQKDVYKLTPETLKKIKNKILDYEIY